MKMVFRWFPNGDDSVTLSQIRQIPCMTGVATCLPHIPVGDIWPMETLKKLKTEINSFELEMEVIESVNVHEDIKKGLPSGDRYIDNYIKTMKNLHEVGVKCICYNFMPVLDWLRSNVEMELKDKSTAMSYEHAKVLKMNPISIGNAMSTNARGFSLPGWEPERMEYMLEDIKYYQNISVDQYLKNMKYFLDAIIPFAEEYDIDMAIHPDDPPWKLFGLPKLITEKETILNLFDLNSSKRNGLAFCIGSLGANKNNDIVKMASEFTSMGRVPFAHLRNVKHITDFDFHETAHPTCCGDNDMFGVVKALHESGFDGYIRPDHGRMIWNEKGRPGYGLYDRALGVTYLVGLWEAITKLS